MQYESGSESLLCSSYSENDLNDQVFEGVDIAHSITCSIMNERLVHTDENNSNSKFGRSQKFGVRGEETRSIEYEKFLDIVADNERLKRENQILKEKSPLKRTLQTNHSQKFIRELRHSNGFSDECTQKFLLNDNYYEVITTSQKIKSLSLLEEYCTAKSMQQKLNSFVGELEKTFEEFFRQKKVYQREINNLKTINEHLVKMLVETEKKLDSAVRELDRTPSNKRPCDSDLGSTEQVRTEVRTRRPASYSFGSDMPYFARTFTHSLEQLEINCAIEQQLQHFQHNDQAVEQLVKALFWVKERLKNGESACQYIDPLELVQSKKLKTWIGEIQNQIDEIGSIQRPVRKYWGPRKNSQIQEFLNYFEKTVPQFIQKLRSAVDKQSFLLNVLLTSYISFLEIYFTEYRNGTVHPEGCQEQIGKFWRLVTMLKMKSGNQHSKETEIYLIEMEKFLQSMIDKQSSE